MSRPIIVSNHVGCARDLAQPRRNGLVFPAGDVGALAAALREAFADPGQLGAWGARSREIIQDYDYEHATRGLRAAVEAVKQGAGSGERGAGEHKAKGGESGIGTNL